MHSAIRDSEKSIWRHAGLCGIVLSGLMLCIPAHAVDMYKCTDSNGSQSFSDKPCGKDAALVNVKVPAAYTSVEKYTGDSGSGYRPLSSNDNLPVVVSNPGTPVRHTFVVDERTRWIGYHYVAPQPQQTNRSTQSGIGSGNSGGSLSTSRSNNTSTQSRPSMGHSISR